MSVAFTLVWLGFWMGFGVLTWRRGLWMSFGQERLRVTYEALEVRRGILGMGRARRYPAGRIEEARPYPRPKRWSRACCA